MSVRPPLVQVSRQNGFYFDSRIREKINRTNSRIATSSSSSLSPSFRFDLVMSLLIRVHQIDNKNQQKQVEWQKKQKIYDLKCWDGIATHPMRDWKLTTSHTSIKRCDANSAKYYAARCVAASPFIPIPTATDLPRPTSTRLSVYIYYLSFFAFFCLYWYWILGVWLYLCFHYYIYDRFIGETLKPFNRAIHGFRCLAFARHFTVIKQICIIDCNVSIRQLAAGKCQVRFWN